jgi:hypothetical protein
MFKSRRLRETTAVIVGWEICARFSIYGDVGWSYVTMTALNVTAPAVSARGVPFPTTLPASDMATMGIRRCFLEHAVSTPRYAHLVYPYLYRYCRKSFVRL